MSRITIFVLLLAALAAAQYVARPMRFSAVGCDDAHKIYTLAVDFADRGRLYTWYVTAKLDRKLVCQRYDSRGNFEALSEFWLFPAKPAAGMTWQDADLYYYRGINRYKLDVIGRSIAAHKPLP